MAYYSQNYAGILGSVLPSTCNDGAVKAKRSDHTSQLIISDGTLSGSSIDCIHENGTNSSNVIDSISLPTIATSSGKLNSCIEDEIISNIILLLLWIQCL